MAVPLAPLIARLEGLLPAFSRPSTADLRDESVLDTVLEVHSALQFAAPGGAGPAERRAAEQLLGAVADKLVALEAALRSPRGRELIPTAAVGMQLCGACGLMSACARLAHITEVGAPILLRLASALVLVTGPARLALVAALAVARRTAPANRTGRTTPANRTALRFMGVLAGSQVGAVNDVLQSALGLPNSQEVLRQMERCLPPVAFARWLSAITDSLLAVGDGISIGGIGPEGHPNERVDLARYADTCRLVMVRDGPARQPLLPTLQAAVESDAALCSKVAQLLFEQVLPAAARQTGLLPLPGGAALPPGRPMHGDWRFLSTTVALLAQPACLVEPCARYYDDHNQQVMHLTLDLVGGMPAACPPDQSSAGHWISWMWLGAMLVQGRQALSVCECCRRGSGRAATEEEMAAIAWRLVELVPKMAAVTREAAAAAEIDGSGGGGGAAGRGNQRQQQQQQGGAMSDFYHKTVQTLCLGWTQALQLLPSASAATSVQQAAAYCAAADAGLRLLPLLMQRHEDMQRRAAGLGGSSSSSGSSGSGGHSRHSGHSTHRAQGDQASAIAALCVSAALSGGAVPEEQCFSGLSEVLLVRVFADLSPRVQHFIREQAAGRELAAPAVLALIPALHQLAATTPRLLFWASGPAQAVPGLPLVLAPGKWQWMALPASIVLQMLHELVEQQSRLHTEQGDEEATKQLYGSLMPTLGALGQALLLVAPILTNQRGPSGQASQMLLVPFVASVCLVMGHHSPTRLTSQLGPELHTALELLAAAPPESVSALAFSVVRAAACSPQFSFAVVRCGSVPLLLDLFATGLRSLPPEQGAAWAQPAQLDREDAEVAELVAAGSCAYLRCANLGGEGGLAAGQGVGSKRCSGCHTAWYCGTACSHADWRQGGHKRMCKVLAAVRQKAKEQRAAERQA